MTVLKRKAKALPLYQDGTLTGRFLIVVEEVNGGTRYVCEVSAEHKEAALRLTLAAIANDLYTDTHVMAEAIRALESPPESRQEVRGE